MADIVGLSEAAAAERLLRDGANELAQAKTRGPLRILFDVLHEPMFVLLLGAGATYLVLGDLGEAATLLVFATLSILITTVQEARSERVLEALRDLTSPRALVIRDGVRKRIPGREVVRGDIVVIAEGDRVPADARLVSGHDIEADESLLTGESVPVRKVPGAPSHPEAHAGGDDLPWVFAGTLIVRGQGLAEVKATGARSEIGKIGGALSTIENEPPPLRAKIERLVRVLAVSGGAVSLAVVLLYGLLRGSWLNGLLSGLAVSMSLLPEEFPLVLTVFMVMGAWRISQARVLTRRAAAIETLGAATVLCTDKTGTLTQNRMRVVELYSAGVSLQIKENGQAVLPESFVALAGTAQLASAPEPFDPMERAIHALHATPPLDTYQLIKTYGLAPDLLAMTQVWRSPGLGTPLLVASKGAPEAIASLCGLDDGAKRHLRDVIDGMAARGLRVLGVARGHFEHQSLPAAQSSFALEFLGLVGLADPLRPSAPAAVAECRAAGIRVLMVTGDYPATARAIAAEAGIASDSITTGAEIALMDDVALATCVAHSSVFARIMPEQKLRIVTALKAAGEVVAMTGDGVNDAPSLKAAHIGIAMGGRGTDVAREAAAIVLLDDDFGSIVRTMRLGRRIYDNLRKAMGYILAVHVPIAGLSLLPLLFDWPLIFTPIHIAFLEMVIDPVCSIVFEAESEEADVMARPPRERGIPLFSRALAGWSLLQGLFVLVLIGAIYAVALRLGTPVPDARALAFVSLVFTNAGLIFANRSFGASILDTLRRRNVPLWYAIATATAIVTLILLWLPARELFQFGPLHADDVAICFLAGVVTVAALNLLKQHWRRRLAS